MGLKKLLHKLFSGNPQSKVKKHAETIFGFEKVDRSKYRKSADLDEEEVITALAKMQTDLNWLKRILWLLVAGGVGEHFWGG